MNRLGLRLRAFLGQPRNIHRVGLIAAAFVAGLVAVGYSWLYKAAERFSVETFQAHPVWLFAAAPASFVLAWWLVNRFAPRAGGSGIPQVMAAIDLQDARVDHAWIAPLLSMRVAAVKIASSALCVAGGGVVGREGPTLQVSASIFYVIGRRIRSFSPIVALDSWMLAGAAAGMAAAFNTPLGGIVYAVEELAAKHFSRVRTTVLSAVLVSGLVSQWLVGSYLYLGFPAIGEAGFRVIPAAFVVGVAGGALGAFFGNVTFRLNVWLRRRLTVRHVKTGFAVALLCALALAALHMIDARALGPGNRLTSEILGGETVGNLRLIGVRVASTTVSYMSGAGGGIFAPSLAIGASLGSWVASWWSGTNAVLLALLGMIAVLTGVTRAPFTSFVLIVEMTDRHSAIFPMMLAALVALGSARVVGSVSFYEQSKRALLRDLEPVRPKAPPPSPAA
ncbi:MAG TPA: chloride channel protein [Candidatus Krumholzibacteria bacterium]|nr:chloride channel protein [Candidatus Krumholzibacteria bacterium]